MVVNEAYVSIQALTLLFYLFFKRQPVLKSRQCHKLQVRKCTQNLSEIRNLLTHLKYSATEQQQSVRQIHLNNQKIIWVGRDLFILQWIISCFDVGLLLHFSFINCYWYMFCLVLTHIIHFQIVIYYFHRSVMQRRNKNVNYIDLPLS